MATRPNFKVTELAISIRWLKGYRYLDKCGEALIQLEDRLDPGWITGEFTPNGGQLKNFRLGMAAIFQASSLNVRQSEFISFEHLQEEACKIYDTLRDTFVIERLNAPTFLAVLQHECQSMTESEELLRDLRFCSPSLQVSSWLGGNHDAVAMTLCTEQSLNWHGSPVNLRRRFECNGVKQERQPDFDNRLLIRLPLLSFKDRQTISALAALRRTHPRISEFAAQISLENSALPFLGA